MDRTTWRCGHCRHYHDVIEGTPSECQRESCDCEPEDFYHFEPDTRGEDFHADI